MQTFEVTYYNVRTFKTAIDQCVEAETPEEALNKPAKVHLSAGQWVAITASSIPHKPYSVRVWWRDGRVETVAESHNPAELAGAPMVARNPVAILRIEIWDLTGCLDSVWDSNWIFENRRMAK